MGHFSKYYVRLAGCVALCVMISACGSVISKRSTPATPKTVEGPTIQRTISGAQAPQEPEPTAYSQQRVVPGSRSSLRVQAAEISPPAHRNAVVINDEWEAAYQSALLAMEGNDYDTAFAKLKPLAEYGHAGAQAALGYLYANGLGVMRDDREAVRLFRESAERGNADGQTNLGYMYARGVGVERDPDEAIKWYLRAAEQGHEGAQANLAAMSTKLKPVPYVDTSTVNPLLEKAEAGDPAAQYLVGLRYITGQGVKKDFDMATKWIMKAAEQNYAAAKRWLEENYQ